MYGGHQLFFRPGALSRPEVCFLSPMFAHYEESTTVVRPQPAALSRSRVAARVSVHRAVFVHRSCGHQLVWPPGSLHVAEFSLCVDSYAALASGIRDRYCPELPTH